VTCMGEIRNAHRLGLKILKKKTRLRRSRCRWEDNTDIDRKGIGCEIVDPIHLAGYMKQESVLAGAHDRTFPASF